MITIRKEAMIDISQHEVISALQPFFSDFDTEVTRGHVSAREQLALIDRYAKELGIVYPEYKTGILFDKTEVDGKLVFVWQRTWSSLLHMFYMTGGKGGKVINPPCDAECLLDYIVGTVNKKGTIIKASDHITGSAIDLSGKDSISSVESRVNQAVNAGVKIKYVKAELANNCVHLGIA